jgi:hypothetical protein
MCPHRPENREAVLNYKRESRTGLACNLACYVDCPAKHPSAASAV